MRISDGTVKYGYYREGQHAFKPSYELEGVRGVKPFIESGQDGAGKEDRIHLTSEMRRHEVV